MTLSKCFLLPCITLALLGGLVSAAAASDSGRFLVRNWQSGDGLPSSIVRSVTQASDGWLWIGTAEGVVRFDGVRFSGFTGEPDATLSRLPVHAIFALPNAEMWIATVGGGLLRWDGQRLAKVWDDLEPALPGKPMVRVNQVVAAGRGRKWILRGEEVWIAEADTAPVCVERTPQIDAELRNDAEMWSRRGRSIIGNSEPILIDRLSRRWSAPATGGLFVTRPALDPQPVPFADAEGVVRIAELYEDHEGNIWVATNESGLVQIRESRVQVLTATDGLSNPSVQAVLQDRRGTLWIATKSGGIDRFYSGRIAHFEAGDPNRIVSSLYEDQAGMVWAVNRGGKVFRFDGEGFRPMFPNITMPGRVVPMLEDKQSRLWFGGQQGLAVWSDGQLSIRGVENGAHPFEATAVAKDANDALLIGTGTGTLLRGTKGNFEMLAPSDALGGRFISGLLPDRDGVVWITTLGSGLYRWKGGRLTHFSEEDGLPDARLTCVLADAAENLWLGSLTGIIRVSKADLETLATSDARAIHCLQLDRSDGMISRECTGLCQPSGCRTADGQLWFPTMNGVVHFDPAKIPLHSEPVPVAILDCKANGRSLGIKGPLLAGPGKPSLEFRYTAFSFAAPDKVRFQVRLRGRETQWRDVGSQRTATFEGILPGSYRFEMRAANGDGTWNDAGAALSVEILPYFWEAPWFRWMAAGILAIAAVAIGWTVARSRMRRHVAALEQQNAREHERARIARDLHDDLGASLTEISLMAQLAVEEQADSSLPKEALPEIATKAQSLVGTLDEIVWAVNPRHDTLSSLAEYLAAFAGEFLDAAGITLRLDIPHGLPSIVLDAERRHNVFLAAREALNNAVKHSGATEIGLQLRADEERMVVIVSDNGCGFDSAQASEGNGARNFSTRLTQLGGACAIESAVGAGTKIRLTVPLRSV